MQSEINSSKHIDNPEKVKNINTDVKNLVDQFGFAKKIIPFISVIIFFIVAFLTIYLFLIPQYNAYKNLGLKLENQRAALFEVEDRLNYLQSLYELRDKLSSNIQFSIESVPDNKDKIPNVLDQLLQIASLSGVTVESQSLSGIVVVDDPLKPKMVKIQMQLSGEKQNLIDFTKILGENRTLVDVDNFSLEKREEDVKTSDFDLKLNLITYYLEDIENSNDVETQKPFTGLESVLSEIENMKYYQPSKETVRFGKKDPFIDVSVINEDQQVVETLQDRGTDSGIIQQ